MKTVFLFEISSKQYSNLGDILEIARQHGELSISEVSEMSENQLMKLVQQFIDQTPVDGYNYVVQDCCKTCKRKPGEIRHDNGLAAGIHCDACWQQIVNRSRLRSW